MMIILVNMIFRDKMSLKPSKAKKATKRLKITNLRKRKVLGPRIVSQCPKQSYKVI